MRAHLLRRGAAARGAAGAARVRAPGWLREGGASRERRRAPRVLADSERRSRAARSRPHRPRRRRPKNIIFPPSPGVGSAPTSPRTRARGRTGSPTTRSPSSTPRWRPRRPPGSTSSTSPRTTSHSHPSRRGSMNYAPSSFTAAGSTSSKGFPSTGTRRGNDARCSTAWARTWAGRARRTRAVTSSGTSKI